MSAAHFEAELGPGPHVPDGSPDLVLVEGGHTIIDHLLELLQVVGLDSPDLCLAATPEVLVKGRLVRAARRPADVRVTGDHARPELLPDLVSFIQGVYITLKCDQY